MCLDQFVGHAPDLIEREDTRRVRVEHHRLVEGVSVASQGGLDGQLVDGDVGPVQSGDATRQFTGMARLQSGPVGEDRHFDDGVGGKVRDQGGGTTVHRVRDVAVERPVDVRLDGADDVGRVLVAEFHLDRRAASHLGACLLERHKIFTAPAHIFVDRDVELGDQGVALDEVGDVLGHVLRALGDEVAKASHHLEAHLVPTVDRRIAHRIPQCRIGIMTINGEIKEPGHVVDAGDSVAHTLVIDTQVSGQLVGGSLHAVAETDGAD